MRKLGRNSDRIALVKARPAIMDHTEDVVDAKALDAILERIVSTPTYREGSRAGGRVTRSKFWVMLLASGVALLSVAGLLRLVGLSIPATSNSTQFQTGAKLIGVGHVTAVELGKLGMQLTPAPPGVRPHISRGAAERTALRDMGDPTTNLSDVDGARFGYFTAPNAMQNGKPVAGYAWVVSLVPGVGNPPPGGVFPTGGGFTGPIGAVSVRVVVVNATTGAFVLGGISTSLPPSPSPSPK